MPPRNVRLVHSTPACGGGIHHAPSEQPETSEPIAEAPQVGRMVSPPTPDAAGRTAGRVAAGSRAKIAGKIHAGGRASATRGQWPSVAMAWTGAALGHGAGVLEAEFEKPGWAARHIRVHFVTI
jgi:hypothetical protein